MATKWFGFLACTGALAFGVAAAAAAAAPAPTVPAADAAALEQAHAELRAAWQKTQAAQSHLAELESRLGIDSPRALAWEFVNNPKRGALGLILARDADAKSATAGLRVQAVSPGGAAETAGLRDGDMLLAIDASPLTGATDNDAALKTLHDVTRTIEVGQRVKLRYQRDGGKPAEAVLVAARPAFLDRHERPHDGEPPGPPQDLIGPDVARGGPQAGWEGNGFRGMGPPPMRGGEWGPPLRVVQLDADLAPYFRTSGGVLVVGVRSVPELPPTGLKAGDVVQSVDGQPVGSPPQFFGLLLQDAGRTAKLAGIRAGAPLVLDAPVPTREAMEAKFGRRDRHRPPFAVE